MNKVSQHKIEAEGIPKNVSKTDRFALKKDPKRCPVCTAKIEKIGKGIRYQNKCNACNAVLAKDIKCSRCNTNRVWRGS
ncbi:MAG: hypothetical protein COA42_19725 [Alteromonadaceae bacterium]|nr:MAG: hypothetical protein COA42_19725 [Alteromonadaceae bacterium]